MAQKAGNTVNESDLEEHFTSNNVLAEIDLKDKMSSAEGKTQTNWLSGKRRLILVASLIFFGVALIICAAVLATTLPPCDFKSSFNGSDRQSQGASGERTQSEEASDKHQQEISNAGFEKGVSRRPSGEPTPDATEEVTAQETAAPEATPASTPVPGAQESDPTPGWSSTAAALPTAAAPTPAPEPAWGDSSEFRAECESDETERKYYCESDCMANCLLLRKNGLLLKDEDSWKLGYCNSTHKKAAYGPRTCCCGEYVALREQAEAVIPCLGGASPSDACLMWCALHSERLLPRSGIDCDPGFSHCFPIGTARRDGCDIAIECSEDRKCCCDLMT
eukprot:CAMPEP_0177588134 /NCGR_PEP_ID=MMETSP0419_2-20121207/6052_1 /TAXON_ID=582737 /ORGANISM="Tetraselmis sp., Strain GSL018" /LENGTH=334 /DNA_ID=CAMNT_0019078289 /DNA_START=109 /DNA_END=1113 /DNA_ORIENTATION=-